MRKSAVVGVTLAIGAGASCFGACVSDSGNGAPGAPDGSFEYDSATPGFDVSAPTVDAAPGRDGAPGADSTVPPPADGGDAGTAIPDSGTDGGDGGTPIPDSGTDADAGIQDAAASFTDVLAPSSWSAFDTATLDAGLISFEGMTFDGRYAYLAPYGSAGIAGIVSRFDTQQTQGSLGTPAAWSWFNTKSVLSGSGRFAGTVYDGRYVYYVPFSNSVSTATNGVDQTFVRYDTQGSFTAGSSWEQFDGSSLVAGPFVGGTFDGRYVYFASNNYSSIAIFDTQGSFTSSGSWTTFDTATLNPPQSNAGSRVFAGAIYDGKYVYFLSSIVTRHDTTAPADAGASAWESFDAHALADAGAFVYQFGAYDGRYLYLVNLTNDVVGRYDTQGTFSSPASWTTFDVSTAGGGAGGFYGANFDGRHLYLSPHGSTIVMYDTQAPFAATSSWTTFDASQVATVPSGYESMLFDGQFMYVASATNSLLLRLEVKTGPGPLPALPLFHGSFF